MIHVDRRVLAWIVSIGLGCLAVGIVMREAWPGLFPLGGGFGAVSVGPLPSLGALPFVTGNIALSVIARRRGGRAASIGSRCLWMIGLIVVATLVVSLMPPALEQSVNTVFFVVLLVVLAMGASIPMQLVVLALLTFVVIGSAPTPREAGDTR
jgi:hypothetical protein